MKTTTAAAALSFLFYYIILIHVQMAPLWSTLLSASINTLLSHHLWQTLKSLRYSMMSDTTKRKKPSQINSTHNISKESQESVKLYSCTHDICEIFLYCFWLSSCVSKSCIRQWVRLAAWW